MAADLNIATLRLRSPDGDSPGLRLRAARQLQAATLNPPGLAPAAVLVVRKVTDPLPGRFGGGRLTPPPEWERAVRDELGGLARAASQPDSSGRLPTDTEAVLFRDEAELLACLLADRATGDLSSRWWWRCVLSRLSLPQLMAYDATHDPAPILCARPREAPAAIALLARWGQARCVALALSTGGAVQALQALARAHALPLDLVAPGSGREAWSVVPGPPGREARQEVGARSIDSQNVAHSADVGPQWPMASPWEEWAPPGLEQGTVPPEVHCLFALANGIHVAPSRVRTVVVAARARAWWAAVTSGAVGRAHWPPAVPLTSGPSPGTDAPHASERDRPARSAMHGDAVQQGGPVRHDSLVGAPRADAAPEPPSRASHALLRDDTSDERALLRGSPHSSARTASTSAIAPTTASPRVSREPHSEHSSEPLKARERGGQPTPRHEPSLDDGEREERARDGLSPSPSVGLLEGLTTRLGGLLFLIHALEDLGLPEGFDARWSTETGGRWGVLDLLARALLGPRLAQLSTDTIWTAFATLADWGPRPARSTVAAGTCDPPFRVPLSWRERLRDPFEHLHWTTAVGRIWLWSDAGYLVAHRRARGSPRAAALREAGSLKDEGIASAPTLEHSPSAQRPWNLPSSVPVGCPPRLRRWAAAVAPALRRRLTMALDRTPDVAARLMIPARLFVTSSHVDVVMKAVDADLVVRSAGLDRDPGWQPAYGRVIYFHFE